MSASDKQGRCRCGRLVSLRKMKEFERWFVRCRPCGLEVSGKTPKETVEMWQGLRDGSGDTI